jgi:hypothetical protein
MTDRRTPAEKKVLSYQKDGRNTYGETGARSRYSIRRRKAGVNRAYRHAVREELSRAARNDDLGEEPSGEVTRRRWTKRPDEPLGAVVRRKLARRERTGISGDRPEESRNQQEAKRRRSQSGDRFMERW